jgi:large subunit ribosomal protein L19
MKANFLTKETILDYGVEKRSFPSFWVGDTLEISQVVTDGNKERIQLFQGDVIAFRRNGIGSTFTVRKIGANGIGVERIFPYYSKHVSKIKVVRRGKVRRAKLNYIKTRTGKAARVKELVLTKEQKEKLAAKSN